MFKLQAAMADHLHHYEFTDALSCGSRSASTV